MVAEYKIVHGSGLHYMQEQLCCSYDTIFMDPPDNIGLKYAGFKDKIPKESYFVWLAKALSYAENIGPKVIWLSFNAKWMVPVSEIVGRLTLAVPRLFVWRYTFGQHRQKDLGSGFRPIYRLDYGCDWDTDSIRTVSERMRMGDKRADPRGRVPDDVLSVPRVTGNAAERRSWSPTQHPIALLRLILRVSASERVLDPFGGSGSTFRACLSLGISSTYVELSEPTVGRFRQEMSDGKLKFKT